MRHLRVVVVADPGIEQVTEDVERIRPGSVFLQKAKKTPGGDRAFVGQVQVGNKEAAACSRRGRVRLQMISALVMTTSSSGTS